MHASRPVVTGLPHGTRIRLRLRYRRFEVRHEVVRAHRLLPELAPGREANVASAIRQMQGSSKAQQSPSLQVASRAGPVAREPAGVSRSPVVQDMSRPRELHICVTRRARRRPHLPTPDTCVAAQFSSGIGVAAS